MNGLRTRIRFCLLSALTAAALFAVPAALAGKVMLRIRVGNTSEKKQVKKVKSNLPPQVRTNHILNLSGLELGYDVKSDLYYVHKEVELPPKGEPGSIVTYRVELDDIWSVPEERLAEFERRAKDLAAMLAGSEFAETAETVRDGILENVAAIRGRQEENAVKPGVKAVAHIQAYEENAAILDDVEKDIGRIENFVLGTGKDPGGLIGTVEDAAAPMPEVRLKPEEYKAAIIRVSVKNPSPKETRRIKPFRYDLPPEIKAYDILDAAGLNKATDFEGNFCYVYAEELVIEPGKTETYNIKIRDKWNINATRIERLQIKGNELLSIVAARGTFKSVEELLQGVLGDLEAIKTQEGPPTLNSAYVAFYRTQTDRLNELEQKLNRVHAALRPVTKDTKIGFKGKPPSMKSTWLIIYIILGFLAVMSLLFFLRWFGRTKAEELAGEAHGR